MKKLSIATLIISAVIFFACKGNSSNNESMNAADTSASNMRSESTQNGMSSSSDTSKMAMQTVDDNTKAFAKAAAEGGMAEVEMGNLAMKNAGTTPIKEFGKMMVDDHTSINNQLKTLAASKNIDLPTTVSSDQQKEIDKLSKLKGAAFDKEYVSTMIDDHKMDINDFQKAGNNLTDNDFKTFISNALPVLQKHLDAINNIKSKM